MSQSASTVQMFLRTIQNIIPHVHLTQIQLDQFPSKTDERVSRWHLPKHTAISEMLMSERQKTLHQQLPNKALFHTIIIQVRAAQTAAPAHTQDQAEYTA